MLGLGLEVESLDEERYGGRQLASSFICCKTMIMGEAWRIQGFSRSASWTIMVG